MVNRNNPESRDPAAEKADAKRRMGRRDGRREKPALDDRRLKDLALNYLSRYATTRMKLARYLGRKLAERGWSGERGPDIEGLLDHIEQLGYLDDESYATMRGASLSRRGYGKRRIKEDLRHQGVDAEIISELTENDASDAAQDHSQWGTIASEAPLDHVAAALNLARRRRIGPFAQQMGDEKSRQKQIGTLVRAGHSFALARHIVDQPPGTDPANVAAEAPAE